MSDFIPFEMQSEIMKRVPTKSLMQFRSVSKPWKSLIDSPKFIADYSFNHTHQHHLLVTYAEQKNYEQKYISVVDDQYHTFPLEKVYLPNPVPGLNSPFILGSSQGLFAFYKNIVKTVHLWNPSIRKSVAIDLSDVASQSRQIVIGFGVCPHTRDPKLVTIDSRYSESVNSKNFTPPWQVEVYTLSSGAWRSIPTINQPRKSILLSWSLVVTNKFIYWLGSTHGYNVIVSFDLTSERCMEVSLPDTLARPCNFSLVISKLKESLVVVERNGEIVEQVYDVWMMEDGASNAFAKIFSINSPNASVQASLVGFWKNNEPIFAMRTDNDVDDVLVHY